jgi:putative iron-only hydrogenase system regulator
MPSKRHVVSIIVEDIENAFHPVSELLHSYAQNILLRVGYPMRDWGVSVIFLVMELSIAEMGAFSGKLGQIKSVKVKAQTLKIEKGDSHEDQH